MSATILRHYAVTARDYDLWKIVVAAASEDEALAKAKSIYATDGFGNTDAFTLDERHVTWHAVPLVQEVQQ